MIGIVGETNMKDERIKLRLSKEEKRTVVALAKKCGYFQIRNGKKEVNLSAYARAAVLQKVKNEKKSH